MVVRKKNSPSIHSINVIQKRVKDIGENAEKQLTSKGLWWESLQLQLFGKIIWLHRK